ncbi:MAG: tetratricopeptide repeat protein [Candidatus Riflebacteria bacterium]|nr:tetratricopeptide repeat protein [Candidatus Riflebacteria bacterium]
MKTKALLGLFLFTHLTGFSADFILEKNFLDKGLTYFYQNNYKAAADYFGQAADLNKNNVWARYYYVYSIALSGRKNEAAKWLPKLSSISNTSQYKQLVSFLNSGNIFKKEETSVKKEKPKSKTKVTNKNKKKDPLDEAEYYVDSGENEKALPIINDYMKKTPVNGKAYKLFAMIDFNNGDYQSSAEKFEKAFKVGVKDFDTYFMAAQANLDIQNYDTALVYYEKASQINAKDLFVKISLADLYCDRADFDSSIRLYKEILKDDPNFIDAKIGLAKVEFKKGYLEESLEQITSIIDENPDNAKAHYLKSQILMDNKDYDNALKEAEAAFSFNPSSIEYRVFCSLVKARNLNAQEAIEDLNNILEMFPNNTYALTALGEALLTEGNMEEGKATLLKSESIKKMPQTALLLALIECNEKNFDKADSLYKEYCSLAGNSPEALLEYANFTELKDNKEECLNSYYAVLEKFPGTPFADKAEKRANEIKQSLSQQSKEKYGFHY